MCREGASACAIRVLHGVQIHALGDCRLNNPLDYTRRRSRNEVRSFIFMIKCLVQKEQHCHTESDISTFVSASRPRKPATMPGHVSIRVSDLEASVQFYLAALAPLRYEATRFDGVVGLGPAPAPSTSSAASGTTTTSTAAGPTPVHVSFYAGEAALVDEFHAEGVRAGGSDNGGPGERPWFKGYYGEC